MSTPRPPEIGNAQTQSALAMSFEGGKDTKAIMKVLGKIF